MFHSKFHSNSSNICWHNTKFTVTTTKNKTNVPTKVKKPWISVENLIWTACNWDLQLVIMRIICTVPCTAKSQWTCQVTVLLPVMQLCVIGRGVQWGQRRRRLQGLHGEASWPPSSLARLALLSPPGESGYLQRHANKDTHLKWKPWFSWISQLLPNIQNQKQHPDLTAGSHVWPGWREQRLPRSWLCWLLRGSGQVAKLDRQNLFGLRLLAPPLLFPPFSLALHPLLSCWPPETQRNITDVNILYAEEKKKDGVRKDFIFKLKFAEAWHSQTSACSSQRRSHTRSPVCGKGSWRAASDMSSLACHQTAGSDTSSGK